MQKSITLLCRNRRQRLRATGTDSPKPDSTQSKIRSSKSGLLLRTLGRKVFWLLYLGVSPMDGVVEAVAVSGKEILIHTLEGEPSGPYEGSCFGGRVL